MRKKFFLLIIVCLVMGAGVMAQTSTVSGTVFAEAAARDDRQYQREHGENHEPWRRGYDHGDVRQRLQVLGEHAQDAARQCESGEYDRQDAKETVASAAWGACFRGGPFRSAGRRAGPPSR